jgi:transcription elongation GreA/GreB family factor
MSVSDKTSLVAEIIARLREERALQIRAAALARDEAISEESRPENKYDTHSQEAAYLAEGQAKLAAEIDESLALYVSLALPIFSPADPVALGALVEVAPEHGASTWYFLGPRAGGLELIHGGRPILVVTPASPLGRQLLGRRVGDSVILPGKHRTSGRIVSIA